MNIFLREVLIFSVLLGEGLLFFLMINRKEKNLRLFYIDNFTTNHTK
jgi:hypothetical protein